MEKKLKEKETEETKPETKPEAIAEMQKLLEEKELKIQELKEQVVVSSSNKAFVQRSEDAASVSVKWLKFFIIILFFVYVIYILLKILIK